MVHSWKFTDDNGSFELPSPQHTSYLYFPLVNKAGMMSSITPLLNGDVKTGQHSFLMLPVSVEDLHNTRSARNFWVYTKKFGAWSATGNAASQIAKNFGEREDEEVTLQAGFLWHRIIRRNKQVGLEAEITNYVPSSSDQVEIMNVRLTNISDQPLHLTPTAAIPIYGRSAENLRDHRHVTSLLHRISCTKHGVMVCPTMTFDERGHQPNRKIYQILGIDANGEAPMGFFPLVEDFIGEGGNLDWPEAVVKQNPSKARAEQFFEGFEVLGGLRFADVDLLPNESCSYILILAITKDNEHSTQLVESYGNLEKFEDGLQKTKAFWQDRLRSLVFQTGEDQYNQWLKWVSIQPTLRQLFGNSFLPYHDYGRGGRGWRDLWQDILSLLIMESVQVDHMLFENFAGVRMDGSNATIIGNQPGEFKADRNNIPRVWMDHGAWPLLTTRLYIDQTGDLAFLLKDQVYFKDQIAYRAQARDMDWDSSQGIIQRTQTGETYQGTVLEHLLVQHLTVFFNVGEHNQIKLEGADWNDGMDMAAQRGESVAFSAMYASNLRQIGQLVLELRSLGHQQVQLASELIQLLDTLDNKVDYDDIETKQQRLKDYFASVQHAVSGEKTAVQLTDLADDVFAKADWLAMHIRNQEWITNNKGYGWFNGYYDNDGQRLEGDHPNGVRMTLTGQVFPLMGGVATKAQAEEMILSVDHYLFDEGVGGYRLNTNFKEVLLNMGRCFGFAYGHKENGAVFSHMAVMYAYALYERGFVRQGYRALDSIYRHSANFPVSRTLPGIPEYFNARGRGLYPYLTGSASWYLLTLLTKAFGVCGHLGDLIVCPNLVKEQFDAAGNASVRIWFAGRQLEVICRNPGQLDYGKYTIDQISLNGLEMKGEPFAHGIKISRATITNLELGELHRLEVSLS